jgi:hypothetical protein
MKLVKMLQEFKGRAQITNRRPAPRPPLLYLMQLRTHAVQATTPRKRLAVEIEAVHAPMTIKINHVKSDRFASPAATA